MFKGRTPFLFMGKPTNSIVSPVDLVSDGQLGFLLVMSQIYFHSAPEYLRDVSEHNRALCDFIADLYPNYYITQFAAGNFPPIPPTSSEVFPQAYVPSISKHCSESWLSMINSSLMFDPSPSST